MDVVPFRAALRREGMSVVAVARLSSISADRLRLGRLTRVERESLETLLGLPSGGLGDESTTARGLDTFTAQERADRIDALTLECELVKRGISRRVAAEKLCLSPEEFYRLCVRGVDTERGFRAHVERVLGFEAEALAVTR